MSLSFLQTEQLLYLSNLSELLEEIFTASTKWYNLGLRLGLQPAVLDAIQVRCQQDPETCLREMLKEWLKQAFPMPSWGELIKALRSTAVGEIVLASKLETKYHAVTAAGPEVRGAYRPENIKDGVTSTNFTEENADESEPSPDNCRKSKNYSFSSEHEPHSSSDSGTSKEQRARQAFGCGCGKCSLTKFLDQGCPEPVKSLSSFPYLETSKLAPCEVMILKGRLFTEFQLISRRFSGFNTAICESLIDQNVPVKKLARALRDLGAFQSSSPDIPLLRDRFDDIKSAKDIDDVFDILADYISFFSFHITEHIVDRLGTPKDKQLLAEYKQELEEYCKRNIFECPCYSVPNPGVAQLVMKVEDFEKNNLKHLTELISRISKVLTVSQYTLQLCSVEKGCVQLNCQVPHFVREVVFPLSTEQTEELKKNKIILLQCGRWKYEMNSDYEIVPRRMPPPARNDVYHGRITRQDSEKRLLSTPFDCFLIRESEKHYGCLTISVKQSSKLNHILIECTPNGFLPSGETTPFATMDNLVTQLLKHLPPCPAPPPTKPVQQGSVSATQPVKQDLLSTEPIKRDLLSPQPVQQVVEGSSGRQTKSDKDNLSDYESANESLDETSENTTDWTGTGDSMLKTSLPIHPPPLPPKGQNYYIKIDRGKRDREHQYSDLNSATGKDTDYSSIEEITCRTTTTTKENPYENTPT